MDKTSSKLGRERDIPRADYLLVGGGLQNALIASALALRQPDSSVVLVERDSAVGGEHTWCFHGTDVAPAALAFVRAFVAHEWSAYDVAFPGLERTLAGAYSCVPAAQLRDVVTRLFAERTHYTLLLGRSAKHLNDNVVELDDGRRLSGRVVIDATGPGRYRSPSVAGYQKFLGLELELTHEHRIDKPLLMDARVPQVGGYRFIYVLPLSRRRLLVEDTYFSDGPELDVPALRTRILEYALARGLGVERVVREETGVLPLPARAETPGTEPGTPLEAGYRGGWFHPTTGYSFPAAVRLAEFVASRAPDALFGPELEAFAREQGRQARFAAFLNRLLFEAFEDADRVNVFERFYALPAPIIARFYALTTTPLDRARIVCGRPPKGVSLRRAVLRGSHP